MKRKRISEFRRTFTVALTFTLPNLTYNNLSKANIKIRRNPLLRFLSMIPNIFTFVAILVGAVRTYWKLESESSKGWMPTPPPPLLLLPVTSSILEGPYNPLARLWCNNSLDRLSLRFFLQINSHHEKFKSASRGLNPIPPYFINKLKIK